MLSPCTIDFDPSSWTASGSEDLHREPYTSRAVLTDGGVYDNLGLETTWKRYETILVSNGGGKMAAEEAPHSDWARHAFRINEIIDNQVRSLRARQVIDSFKAGIRKGSVLGHSYRHRGYGVADALPCPLDQTTALAETPTRLKELPDVTQERLINWGYAVCDAGDAATRRHDGVGAGAFSVSGIGGGLSPGAKKTAAAGSRPRGSAVDSDESTWRRKHQTLGTFVEPLPAPRSRVDPAGR